MRLIVTCALERTTVFPVNHQQQLAGAAYGLLNDSDPDYARFLHDEGYAGGAGSRRYKLFTFSGLRVPKQRRRIKGDRLWLSAGPVEWIVSSPCASFLTHFATGLLSSGGLRVGNVLLPVVQAQTCPVPDFTEGTARFTCLTPLVASRPVPASEGGGKYYLRPSDGIAFSEALRNNLLRKYMALHGKPPVAGEDSFAMTFDAEYLARNAYGGTKKITFKGIEVIGALAPFTVTGSQSLIALGYEAGFGELNASGFGMVELQNISCEERSNA